MRAVGAWEVLVELMMARAAERRAFGRALIDYDATQQAIARRCADPPRLRDGAPVAHRRRAGRSPSAPDLPPGAAGALERGRLALHRPADRLARPRSDKI